MLRDFFLFVSTVASLFTYTEFPEGSTGMFECKICSDATVKTGLHMNSKIWRRLFRSQALTLIHQADTDSDSLVNPHPHDTLVYIEPMGQAVAAVCFTECWFGQCDSLAT